MQKTQHLEYWAKLLDKSCCRELPAAASGKAARHSQGISLSPAMSAKGSLLKAGILDSSAFHL